jgi:two-component system nitrogen regulation response regulator NtrX
VQLAENAAAARAARQRLRPDLVLLDIWMPDTDGITLLKEWGRRPAQHAGGDDVRPRHHRHGGRGHAHRRFDFLEKPIALQKLLAAVKRALQKSVAAGTAQRADPGRLRPLRAAARPEEAPRADGRPEPRAAAEDRAGQPGRTGARAACRRRASPGSTWPATASRWRVECWSRPGGMLFAAELAALPPAAEEPGLRRSTAWRNLTCAWSRPARRAPPNWRRRAGTRRCCAAWRGQPRRAGPGRTEGRGAGDRRADPAHLVEAGEVPLRRLSTAALNALRNQAWSGRLCRTAQRRALAGAGCPRGGNRRRGGRACWRRSPPRRPGAAARPAAARGARGLRAHLLRAPPAARRRQHDAARRKDRPGAHPPLPQAQGSWASSSAARGQMAAPSRGGPGEAQ